MNILVLAGGYSPERDVSLASGCVIANALMKNGWNVADYIQGELFSVYTDRRLGNTYFCLSDNLDLYP